MAREFQFWFLQLFSNILWASTRWIIPLNGFWISPVEKRHPFLTLSKSVFVGKRLFASSSWILPGTRGCKASSGLQSESPRPWLRGLRAALSSRQQSDWWQHSSSCQLSPEHSRKAPHVPFRTTESSCSSTLMRLWQQNNFQNVLRPRAPLK